MILMYDVTDRYGFELEQKELLEKINELEKENIKLKHENEILHKTIKFLVRHP